MNRKLLKSLRGVRDAVIKSERRARRIIRQAEEAIELDCAHWVQTDIAIKDARRAFLSDWRRLSKEPSKKRERGQLSQIRFGRIRAPGRVRSILAKNTLANLRARERYYSSLRLLKDATAAWLGIADA